MVREPETETALHTVLGLLVEGEYGVLAAMTQGKQLTADDMRMAVESYGRTTYNCAPGGRLAIAADLPIL